MPPKADAQSQRTATRAYIQAFLPIKKNKKKQIFGYCFCLADSKNLGDKNQSGHSPQKISAWGMANKNNK